MVTLRGSNDPLRLMWRRLLIALLSIVVISVMWGVWDIYRKNSEAGRLRSEAEARLKDVQTQEAKLQSDYKKLSTSRGMEEALREQYAVAAEGESMVVIVEP